MGDLVIPCLVLRSIRDPFFLHLFGDVFFVAFQLRELGNAVPPMRAVAVFESNPWGVAGDPLKAFKGPLHVLAGFLE